MPTYFQRPENALKRANEFIDVGKKQRALDALYDVIKSKKHRAWQKIHEPIMEKYLGLCVELKKSHIAKEGLYQYKNICQSVNVKSLEDVVRKYLSLAAEKTEEARQESNLAVQAVQDIDDLDVLQTPESLLLSAVSGEDTQDRTDRAILTPWVKFLWESYRQCLELLRNNSSVEKLYQDIAQQAFKFCLKYTRKTEFRKLCDNLRTHLGHVHKYQHQQRAINLNNPESQAMHLETRLVQLDSAIQMELWQEAFKAVEDIHGLIALSKKPPKPSLMSNYYQKLGLVFWKSGNHMFHACAWHKLYHLSRDQRKNLSTEELQKLSSRVLCATLAIPLSPSRNEIAQALEMDENTKEKKRRLATLLGMNTVSNRNTLVKDLIKYKMIEHVHPELQNLYNWLEVEFHPLKLASCVMSSLKFIEEHEDLNLYVESLQDITITRLLKQVSQVYQTIEFKRLCELAPFAGEFHLEQVIVSSAKDLDLQVRIDHRTRALTFGVDLCTSQREDTPEGPHLQSMPTEHLRSQLTHMAQALDKATKILQPKDRQKEELRAHIVQSYRQTARKEHQRILMRRQIIEERKEELENISIQREHEEQKQIEDQKKKQYEAEMARLEREAEERERQRRLQEHQEIAKKAAKERLEQLKSTALGAKVFATMDEDVIAQLDADEIMAKQVEQLEKEKKEMQEKLRQQEKKVDYLERAKRLEEIPLLEKKAQEDSVAFRVIWEEEQSQRIESLKQEREMALKHRDRMMRMEEDKEKYLTQLKTGRESEYKEKLEEFEKRFIEEKKKRLAERREKRKEERRAKYYKEKEEEEQRKRDEEAKRLREEEERREREEKEAMAEEYRLKLEKLNEIEERKRQKEREIEERERKEREEMMQRREADSGRSAWRKGPGESDDRGGWRSERPSDRDRGEDHDGERGNAWKPAAREGGWREREKAREDSWKKPSADVDDHDGDRPHRDDGRGPGRGEPGEGPWRGGHRDAEHDEPRREWRGGRDDRGGGGWRDSPRDREDGGGWRDRGPPRDDRDGPRDRDDRGGWRDRGPPRDRDDKDRWRRDDRDDRRDDRGGDRGGWRDRDRDRDDRPRPPLRDEGGRDGGSSWRDRERGGGSGGNPWRRGGDDGRDTGGDRGGGSWRDRREGGGGGGWRDRGGPRDDRGPGRGDRDRDPPRRDDRGPMDDRRDDRGGDSWRRGSPTKDRRDMDRGRSGDAEREPEGWTTVRR